MSINEDLRTPVAVSEEPKEESSELKEMLRTIEEGAKDTHERIAALVDSKASVTSSEFEDLEKFVESAADEADTLEELSEGTLRLNAVRALIVNMRSMLSRIPVMSEAQELRVMEREERRQKIARTLEARSQRLQRIKANKESAPDKVIPDKDVVVTAVHDIAPTLELVGVDCEGKSKSALKKFIKKAKRLAKASLGEIVYLEDQSPARVGFVWRNNQLIIPTGEATVIQKES